MSRSMALPEDDVPELSSDDEDDHDDGWREMDTEESHDDDQCLFCAERFDDVDAALSHCRRSHNFDLSILKVKHDMDFYSYIKLIGYIRTVRPDAVSIMSALRPLWEDEKYLKPVRQENWLMYDFDSLNEGLTRTASFHANVENGLVTLSEAHFAELQKSIQSLTARLKEKDDQLLIAAANIERMKQVMRSVIGDDRPDPKPKTPVTVLDEDDDSGYFHTYSHFGIHHDMLSDKIRTDSYRDALLNNSDAIADRTVLDLGCGTGILSMFSVKAGANKVYAVDQSDIIYQAMDIIRENGMNDKITPVKGRIEDLKLPQRVDVLVSEWMGYFLLFEGMLDSVIFARDKWLKPGGLMLPNRCTVSLVGSGDVETHSKLIGFWSDVYGFRMNCMKGEVIKEASVELARSKHLITTPNTICDIDMYTCTTESVNFTSDFNLRVLDDGCLAFFVGYFDTHFDLPNAVFFSTGPEATGTHWKQTIFYLKEPIPVKKGECVVGKLECTRNSSDVRGLIIKITVFNQTHKYIMN